MVESVDIGFARSDPVELGFACPYFQVCDSFVYPDGVGVRLCQPLANLEQTVTIKKSCGYFSVGVVQRHTYEGLHEMEHFESLVVRNLAQRRFKIHERQ